MRPWLAALATIVIVIAAVVLVARIRSGPAGPESVSAGDPVEIVAASVVTEDAPQDDRAGVATLDAPLAAAPSAPTAETISGTERLETYVSPRYGYALTYDEAAWDTFTLQNTLTISGYLREMDVIELRHQTAPVTIRIMGERGWIGGSNWMPNCVEDELLAFTSFDGHDPLASPVQGGGDGRAWAQLDYMDGASRVTVYAECWWIGGDVTLTIRHTAPIADFPQSVGAREDILAGLDAAGIFGVHATPGASPVANATPAATPVGTSANGS